MAGSDNIQFNLLERAVSRDWNDVQSLQQRMMAETLRWMLASHNPFGPGDVARSAVCGGFLPTDAGPDVQVGPGWLVQQAPGLAPVPGLLDSTFRQAISLANVNVPKVIPGADTWHLLEGQMVESIESTENRDIFTPPPPVPGTFTPTPVPKRRVYRVGFRLRVGGATIPGPTADWVPLYGVLLQAGTGLVLEFADVRPVPVLASAPVGGFPSSLSLSLDTVSTPDVASNLLAQTASHASVIHGASGDADPLGVRWPAGVPFDPTSIRYVSPGTVLAANTWFYLYLGRWNGIAARSFEGNVATRGVLVLSSVAPTQGVRQNSAGITLPAPWSTVVAAGNAPLVAALRRNSANTGWDSMRWANDEARLSITPTGGSFTNQGAAGGTLAAATFNLLTVGWVPPHAKEVEIYVSASRSGGDSAIQMRTRVPGGVNPVDQQTHYEAGLAGDITFRTWWPLHLGTSVTVEVQTDAAVASFNSWPSAWRG